LIDTASFCCQLAAWVPKMFCNFYFCEKHNIANNTTANEARGKISSDWEALEFEKKIDLRLYKFKKIHFY
jgi:hypothetical protein